MMSELNDPELHTRLLDADPVELARLRTIAGSTGAEELRAAITASPLPVPATRHRRRLAVLAVAAVAAVATPLAFTVLAPSTSHQDAFAAAAVQFADDSPRLLAGAPGWPVTDLNDEGDDQGMITFGSGATSVEVDWVTPAGALDDNEADMTPQGLFPIDGRQAWVGRYPDVPPTSGPGGDFQAIWAVGGQTLSARGTASDLGAFLHVVQSLHRVDVGAFLAALPADVVTPAGRRAAVEGMLADIPQPPGFDPSDLLTTNLLLDRYQLGAAVTSEVGCGWLTLWVHGDATQQVEAAAAMGSSRQWAILREMAPQGAFAQGYWADGDLMNGIVGPTTNFSGTTPEAILKNHLTCK